MLDSVSWLSAKCPHHGAAKIDSRKKANRQLGSCSSSHPKLSRSLHRRGNQFRSGHRIVDGTPVASFNTECSTLMTCRGGYVINMLQSRRIAKQHNKTNHQATLPMHASQLHLLSTPSLAHRTLWPVRLTFNPFTSRISLHCVSRQTRRRPIPPLLFCHPTHTPGNSSSCDKNPSTL